MKAFVILKLIQIGLWAVLIGAGIFYMSSILGGAGLPYVSMPRFLNAIGACDEYGVCDIASAEGCFLCPYVLRLFLVIGDATYILWDAIVWHTWLLLVIGLVIFMFWKAYQILWDSIKATGKLDGKNKMLNFFHDKGWFKEVKDLFIRILIAGAFLGVIGLGGNYALRATTNVVVYPVMVVGTSLAMAASGMHEHAVCSMDHVGDENIIAPVANSFMCIIGNLNTSILVGASSGFAMMNMSWLGMGGGFFTWLGGLLVVVMFLFVGFRVVFDVLNVVFSIVFVIIFLPLFIASYAFEKVWTSVAGNAVANAISIIAGSAVRVIGITLKVIIFTTLISFAQTETLSSNPELEFEIMYVCEGRADYACPDREADNHRRCFRQTYYACFQELSHGTDAFLNLRNGFQFLISMLFIFIIYYWLVQKKIEGIITSMDKDGSYFKFGSTLQGGLVFAWASLGKWLGGLAKVKKT